MSNRAQQIPLINGFIAPPHLCVPATSIQISDCHGCESRDGCLADKMMSHPGYTAQVKSKNHVFRRGDHIFREGDLSSALNIVRSGSVKTYQSTEEGEEQVLGFNLPGDVIGLDGLENQKGLTSAIALETTSICKLPFAQLTDSGRGQVYPKLISQQISRDYHLFLMLVRKNADSRIASFLTDLSQRFESKGLSANVFNLSMSRQDIGNYLGLAIETVSRTLTRFQESGLIKITRRTVEINDCEKLRRIARA
ncbi:MAG: CRP/FNR family transcriptional regulator [Gammaproteobacteria bacterium]|jgi:CRP/FNR family transcriptional regulator